MKKRIKLLQLYENLLLGGEKEVLLNLIEELKLSNLPILILPEENNKKEFPKIKPLIIFYKNEYFLNIDEKEYENLKGLYFLEFREEDFLISLKELIDFLKRRYKIEKNFKELSKIKNWSYIEKRDDEVFYMKRGSYSLYFLEKELGKRIKIRKDNYFNILIVCTGNTCRSPMAKGILENYLKDYPVFIYSAGTSALRNSPPSSYAEKALKEIGIDISNHRSQQINEKMVWQADLILCAERNHIYYLETFYPEFKDKIFLIKGYPNKDGEDLLDPIGLDYDVYVRVREELKAALKKVAEDIKERFN
ncbi:MAG: low molecular weight protein arginine phosphatase [candidate division WOR-3 bacterium]|nr:low molecular weight protein arginine phosphatase [candidate division WOR-3 bacterium]